jgi:murein DD-endopeptidase MepM/ murein hydrolase activator NlpD
LPILAFRSGTVSVEDDGFNGIYIKHDDGTASYYLHSSEVLVKNGEKVKAGQIISKMGGKGPGGVQVYPIHLHFQLYNSSGGLIDPATVILDSNNQPNKANVKIIGNPQGMGGGL